MFESLFKPAPAIAPIERTPAEQAQVNHDTRLLVLYHQESCWYCARVRRVIEQLKLQIEQRDIVQSAEHRQALVDGGGSTTVPCLRIEDGSGDVHWMYESTVIIDYLTERFGKKE